MPRSDPSSLRALGARMAQQQQPEEEDNSGREFGQVAGGILGTIAGLYMGNPAAGAAIGSGIGGAIGGGSLTTDDARQTMAGAIKTKALSGGK